MSLGLLLASTLLGLLSACALVTIVVIAGRLRRGG